jgi:hypothetical protein
MTHRLARLYNVARQRTRKEPLALHLAALLVALTVCLAAIAIGSRFLLAPRQATLAFGVAADNLRALTEIKGVRDITSGAVPLVVWAAAGRTALGWALIATALTSTADATIVLTNGGKLSTALGIHGLTAGLLVAAGLVLAMG